MLWKLISLRGVYIYHTRKRALQCGINESEECVVVEAYPLFSMYILSILH